VGAGGEMVQPKYLVLCNTKCQREDVAIENYTGEAGLLFGRLIFVGAAPHTHISVETRRRRRRPHQQKTTTSTSGKAGGLTQGFFTEAAARRPRQYF